MKKILLIIGLLSISLNAQTAGNGFTDINGNTYSTVIIGSQEWMTSNLRVSLGTMVQVNVNSPIYGSSTPLYFPYAGNRYYNWNAIGNTNFENGWHVPTMNEWSTLIANSGGTSSLFNNGFFSQDSYQVGYNTNLNSYTVVNFDNTAIFWTIDLLTGGSARCTEFGINSQQYGQRLKTIGLAVRLVKNVSLSTNQFYKSNIKVYPNPASDILNIESQEEVNHIEIFDLLGKQILSFKGAKNIDVSGLQNGIYLLKINTEKGSLTEKFIKNGTK